MSVGWSWSPGGAPPAARPPLGSAQRHVDPRAHLSVLRRAGPMWTRGGGGGQLLRNPTTVSGLSPRAGGRGRARARRPARRGSSPSLFVSPPPSLSRASARVSLSVLSLSPSLPPLSSSFSFSLSLPSLPASALRGVLSCALARHLRPPSPPPRGPPDSDFRQLSAEYQREALYAAPESIGIVSGVGAEGSTVFLTLSHGPSGAEVTGVVVTEGVLRCFGLCPAAPPFPVPACPVHSLVWSGPGGAHDAPAYHDGAYGTPPPADPRDAHLSCPLPRGPGQGKTDPWTVSHIPMGSGPRRTLS